MNRWFLYSLCSNNESPAITVNRLMKAFCLHHCEWKQLVFERDWIYGMSYYKKSRKCNIFWLKLFQVFLKSFLLQCHWNIKYFVWLLAKSVFCILDQLKCNEQLSILKMWSRWCDTLTRNVVICKVYFKEQIHCVKCHVNVSVT